MTIRWSRAVPAFTNKMQKRIFPPFFTIAYPKTRVGHMKCTVLLEVEVIALHENFHTSGLHHTATVSLIHHTSELSHVTLQFTNGKMVMVC